MGFTFHCWKFYHGIVKLYVGHVDLMLVCVLYWDVFVNFLMLKTSAIWILYNNTMLNTSYLNKWYWVLKHAKRRVEYKENTANQWGSMNSSSITKGSEFVVAMELEDFHCVDTCTALHGNIWRKNLSVACSYIVYVQISTCTELWIMPI